MNPDSVNLTIWQITQMVGIAVGSPRKPADSKPVALQRLLVALKGRLGDKAEEVHRRVLSAGSCEKALALLKGALIEEDRSNGVATARLEATTINGLGVEFIQAKRTKEKTMNDQVQGETTENTDGTDGTGEKVDAPKIKKVRTAVNAGKLIKHTCKIDPETGGVINPRKPGSHGHRSMELVIQAGDDGIMYEDYIKAGGRPNDLAWDIDHGNVSAEIA